MLKRILFEISVLSPSYFGSVMATGVVSIILKVYGLTSVAVLVAVLNLILYTSLVLLNLVRIISYRDRVRGDLLDLGRGLGYLTAIAGTDVVGDDLVLVLHMESISLVLWGASLVLWILLQYYFLFTLTVREEKGGIQDVNGLWLLLPVSTLTLSVLSLDLSTKVTQLIYPGLITYFVGWVTYLVITVLISSRLFLSRVKAGDVIPAYWINGGFPALASLSSSLLILHASPSFPILLELRSFLLGTGVLVWAYGTWWMPLLFLLFAWKHVAKHISFLKYDFQFWSAVFPIAVYDLGTYFTARVTGIPGVSLIALMFAYISVGLWVYQLSGFVYNILVKLRKPLDA
ncbi:MULTISPECIES: tellurite resistance/C4-dicarboxylate transporter family protein [Metallosphaera]|uniref:tellurite resistance/C4-dicarboxylate transporter family protein n=1 Tax=Metallosphaera TaxID=41980 RepID=UPI001F0606BE|nr:tellurite resistance/C4-dicarboxylate transporter family protein [Metallosphaera sedula]MCH1770356.1 tellurite resistance/C4-dicarboxylate transporter family protein [Metallosphaera sedula]MCP6727810.1 tellurite resistance/C4-dicarboxylate transporter family protein [Metallosphaera sedula]